MILTFYTRSFQFYYHDLIPGQMSIDELYFNIKGIFVSVMVTQQISRKLSTKFKLLFKI